MNKKIKITIGVALIVVILAAFVVVNSKQVFAGPAGGGRVQLCVRSCMNTLGWCFRICGNEAFCLSECLLSYDDCIYGCYHLIYYC